MTPFNHSDRLRRFSKAMAMLTTLGMLLTAIAMIAVFLVPDWTRNLLLARLGQAGHDLSLSPERLIAAATCGHGGCAMTRSARSSSGAMPGISPVKIAFQP